MLTRMDFAPALPLALLLAAPAQAGIKYSVTELKAEPGFHRGVVGDQGFGWIAYPPNTKGGCKRGAHPRSDPFGTVSERTGTAEPRRVVVPTPAHRRRSGHYATRASM